MSTSDGRFHITFNGEIYNYQELRKELEKLGHRFLGDSDTEVLLHAFAEWREGCLLKLVGMFAFGVLDTHKRQVTLVRDHFGIKPLFTCFRGGQLLFSSEIPALLSLEGVSPVANSQLMCDFLRRGSTDHTVETMIAGISNLPPSHYLTVPIDNPRASQLSRYWQLDSQTVNEISADEAYSEFRSRFFDSVELHMRSDVGIGGALSGGLDSSSILTAARALDPESPLHAISFIDSEKALSEEHWVDIVSQRARLEVTKVRVAESELINDLDSLVRIQGEPFRGPGILAQYLVFRGAHEAGIKVMLDGQGADEMLGGYRPFASARMASLVRAGRPFSALRLLGGAGLQPGRDSKWTLLGRAVVPLLPQFAAIRLSRLALASAGSPSLLSQSWMNDREVDTSPTQAGSWWRSLRGALAHSLEVDLPSLLRFEDRNSMSFSVESRVPFLNHHFVQWVVSLPEDLLVAEDGTSKYVLRQAMRGVVPDQILDRREKLGFTTSSAKVLRSARSWVDETLNEAMNRDVGPIDIQSLARQIEESRGLDGAVPSNLWGILTMLRWAQINDVKFEP